MERDNPSLLKPWAGNFTKLERERSQIRGHPARRQVIVLA